MKPKTLLQLVLLGGMALAAVGCVNVKPWQRGKLADYITSDPSPKDWRPTMRHLLPGSDIPMLLNRFVDPKQGALVTQASNMAFAGLQVPFTVPT